MAGIKVTLEDGMVIEGSAEDIAEMSTLLDKSEEGDEESPMKTVTRQAKVGETIIVTDNSHYNMRDMTVGRPYEVVDAGTSNTYVNVIDDVGDEATVPYRGYKVEIEDSPEFEFEVGDKVKVIREVMSIDKYEVGDILTVESVDSGGNLNMEEFDDPIVFPSEVEIHHRGNGAGNDEFNVGDVVELMFGGECAGMCGISSGDHLKVIAKTGGVMNYEVKSLTNKSIGYVNGSKLRLIKSKSSDSQKIKVGDKVILKAGDKENEVPLFNMFNGKTYQVESVESDGMYWIYDGSVFSGATPFGGGYASRDQLVLVDDRRGKEVVEVGDIAEVTEYHSGFAVGTIGEVGRLMGNGIHVTLKSINVVSGDLYTYYEKNVKLIARAGDRYDN